MKRLQTYFSLLSTLLSLFSGAIILLIGFFAFGFKIQSFWVLLPAGAVVFLISLLIGHFISEPLRALARNAHSFINGSPSFAVTHKGELYEADCLTESFEQLANMTATQQADLALREKRQTAFISDVAHELRTPLTAIQGNAEMLLDPDLPPDLRERFCRIIIEESRRLGRLSNDLLTLQHIEGLGGVSHLQRVDLRTLIQEVLESLSPLLRDRQAHIQVVGEAPDVLGDSDRLKQVVSNLVENASRFIKPQGHISLELFGLQGNSVIAVKDDGVGFGNVDPQLLFDRFYRADFSRSRDSGGSGLGLAIVKSIVEAHDGSIEAFNLPEGGACFIIAMPSILGD
ncbi:MAG: HAMP domain-containing histidine kinase [Coriobacteriaceae bacterium]|jgi:two-component system OmpR family sensor kinase|nr:HAMP domain-containing histidine kinase [Coriobacteriaceae bacterium]